MTVEVCLAVRVFKTATANLQKACFCANVPVIDGTYNKNVSHGLSGDVIKLTFWVAVIDWNVALLRMIGSLLPHDDI
jgi:uncharacterized membrane protein YraQ (UPF0718 family)